MTYDEAFKIGIQILRDAQIEAPTADAGALLCAAAKCGRVFLYTHGEAALDEKIRRNYLRSLKKRARGYPLQYLTGVQEFMSLPFEVGPGVLIPRQETELLVETVIRLCEDRREESGELSEAKGTSGGKRCSEASFREGKGPGPRILDIGTGSGCIAVSLAHYLPRSIVTAADKMEDALAAAIRNAERNGVAGRVHFVLSDLFENITEGPFDVIVSNPPYIRSAEIAGLQREIREHEPYAALDGGADGLVFYRKIVGKAPDYLKKGGALAFETGYDQAADVAALMSDHFTGIKILRDLSGIGRVVLGICEKIF